MCRSIILLLLLFVLLPIIASPTFSVVVAMVVAVLVGIRLPSCSKVKVQKVCGLCWLGFAGRLTGHTLFNNETITGRECLDSFALYLPKP